MIAAVATCAVGALGVGSAVVTSGGGAGASTANGVMHHTSATRHNPYGYLDVVRVRNHMVSLVGWTFDPDRPRVPTRARISIDGHTVASIRSFVRRPGVSRYFHRTVVTPGFQLSVAASYGRHILCVYGVNYGAGRTTRITCRPLVMRDPHDPSGKVSFAVAKDKKTVRVSGAAYDPDARSTSLRVRLTASHQKTSTVKADRADSAFNRAHRKVSGRHGFVRTVKLGYGRTTVCVTALNIKAGSGNTKLACTTVARSTQNQLIAAMAKQYVGHVRYRSGGSSPRSGFDCSGLTRFVYARQNIKLAHSANAQFHHFRKISRKSARPGDLVFFLSGGHAYHVGVYEGGNKIVAAATYGEGVKYQSIWTSRIKFGTVLH